MTIKGIIGNTKDGMSLYMTKLWVDSMDKCEVYSNMNLNMPKIKV